jgi:hypothetical protein
MTTGLTADVATARRPLREYAALVSVFNAAFFGALAAASSRGRLPERVGAGDVLLFGTATHKLSRLIARERVTSFVRAPFTAFQQDAGHGEVDERPRGTGLRRAIGELLVCPYCLGLWVSGGFHAGRLFAPRATRIVASTFAALTIADVLQLAYRELIDAAAAKEDA